MINLEHFFLALGQLKTEFPCYCFTATKWDIKKDILDGYSDLDIRLVVDSYSEDEIHRFCLRTADIFHKLKTHDNSYSRLFEHTPGFIYTLRELRSGFGNGPDIATWSFLHGRKKSFDVVKKSYLSTKSTHLASMYFRDLFESRIEKYSLELELFYHNKNIESLKKYYLAWHYYATIIYAASGLYFSAWPRSKTSDFFKIQKKFPSLRNCDRDILIKSIEDKKISVSQFENDLREEALHLKNNLCMDENTKQACELESNEAVSCYFIAIAMIRARMARYHLYKTYFENTQPRLLEREKQDYLAICKYLNLFIAHSSDKEPYLKIIKEINELRSLDFSLKSTFEKISGFFVDHGYEINNLGFLLLQEKIGQVSINCLKIKITSKCTRKCSYCIFSDNREQDLSFEKFKLIIKKFKGIHVDRIFINGGEPTLHPSLELIGKYLKEIYPSKELVIGTNCTIISKSNKIFQIVTKYFDTFAIGCDDEHRNFDDVKLVAPKIRSLGKTVVVNTLMDFISDDHRLALDLFCKENGIIHVYNSLHHFCIGRRNKIGKICSKLAKINLMITKNGDCFRCFNAVDEKHPEFNINDSNFLEKVFRKRKQHYKFCYYCDEYRTSN